jgi:hemin uptake protein HemP
VEEKKGDTGFLNQHKTIHSHELLQHGKEVFIQHKGEQYLLRCTRNGKLILTK